MVCYGELYRLKPDPRHLTGFYLMIAAGGALGGLFVAVVAPLIFTDYFELHWGLLMCGVLFLVVCLRDLRPVPSSAVPGSRLEVRGSWFKVRSVVVFRRSASYGRPGRSRWLSRSGRQGAQIRRRAGLARARNFYGVLTGSKHDKLDMRFLELMHVVTSSTDCSSLTRCARPGRRLITTSGSGVGLAMVCCPPVASANRPGRPGRRHAGRLWPPGGLPAVLRDQPGRAAAGEIAVHLFGELQGEG